MQRPVIAVVGPTAAGKSDLSLALARALDGEVVNADSMQLYQGMDIGTAKLTEAERAGIPHHLLDIWPVTQAASVSEYQVLARAAIADIQQRGRTPILVGGSGLYVRAAIDDLQFPGTDAALRAGLEAELARLGPAALHARLGGAGPGGGRGHPAHQRPPDRARPGGHPAVRPAVHRDAAGLRVGLPGRPDRRQPRPGRAGPPGRRAGRPDVAAGPGRARCARWPRRGLREGRTASRALGYAQVLRFLDGDWSEAEAAAQTVQATRRFVRRQESWFRRDPRVSWLPGPGAGRR